MSVCSYVQKRRQRYYFRVRLPVEAVEILGRTHVLGSLLTSDSRTAKIRASAGLRGITVRPVLPADTVAVKNEPKFELARRQREMRLSALSEVR